ncbi:hypothetical protein [Rhizobium sp. Leaf341]|uniref:hypothetical protein n=1 Tax=Rhizobium sp. Leaf341 TaxID=1736344 RepID=UPI000714AB2F|nr:hypothetical protein [Rhizobium sp. Leaf341]KQR67884.1 hypothetical protein ASG03_10210 [Rhizobium sp. Leaf341]
MIRKFLAVSLAALMMTAGIAEARSSFSSRSFSSRSYTSRSYSAPRPAYRSTTVNNNTYIRQSSGGGMMSNIFGTMIGMGAYNWLFGDDEKPVETPAVPAAPVVPTAPAVAPAQ